MSALAAADDHARFSFIASAGLGDLEEIIDAGRTTFMRVGMALARIRDDRLYKDQFGTFEDYCKERWGWGRNYSNKLINAHRIAEDVGYHGTQKPIRERQVRELARLDSIDDQAAAWAEAVDGANGEQPTTKQVRAAVAKRLPAGQTSNSLHSSVSNERYTPAKYIEAARTVLGGIDLDPASCERANRLVRAGRYFTEDNDGLKQYWSGRVWMNPPYGKTNGKSNQGLWLTKLLDDYDSCRLIGAIALVNAVTDRTWFAPLWRYPLCFSDHRIRFESGDGDNEDSPTHGSVFVYLGRDPDAFKREFGRFGQIVLPADDCAVAA